MTLAPIERGSSIFAAFETALAAAGLPAGDLEADGAQYFAFEHRDDEPLAFVGMITFGTEGLLRSLVVREAQRGQSHGTYAVDAVAQFARRQGMHRLWLLTTDAERYFIGKDFGLSTARTRRPPSQPRANSLRPVLIQRC